MQSALFSKINETVGYAIPTDKFWKMWNSDQRDLLVRVRLIPKPLGFELGESCRWVVVRESDYVSYAGSEHDPEPTPRRKARKRLADEIITEACEFPDWLLKYVIPAENS